MGWNPINVCTERPKDVLVHAQRLATSLRVLSWALSNSEVASNLDPEDFDGLTEIAMQLENVLKEAIRHIHLDCPCNGTDPQTWAWPIMTKR